MTCANEKYDRETSYVSKYCTPRCGVAQRNRESYRRKKDGVKLKKCRTCNGTGKVPRKKRL